MEVKMELATAHPASISIESSSEERLQSFYNHPQLFLRFLQITKKLPL